MRTWKQPNWMKEQEGIAQARGYAYVKNHYKSPSAVKVLWKDSWRVKDEFGKKGLFEMHIKDKDGETKVYVFDAEEIRHWIAYA